MVGMASNDNAIKVFFISKAFKFLIIFYSAKVKRKEHTTKKNANN
jgi:hypothetical protein